jgi:hypothetical protein
MDRALLVASHGQFSNKGYVRVASRVVNPPPVKENTSCVPRSVEKYNSCAPGC